MKYLFIQRQTPSGQTIVNLDNVEFIDWNTKANTCRITFVSGNTQIFTNNELAQLIKGLKQYNEQLLVNLCGEEEF